MPYKRKNLFKLLIFFVIIFISADIVFLNVSSASSDKEIILIIFF